jgi:hypothetical protein
MICIGADQLKEPVALLYVIAPLQLTITFFKYVMPLSNPAGKTFIIGYEKTVEASQGV